MRAAVAVLSHLKPLGNVLANVELVSGLTLSTAAQYALFTACGLGFILVCFNNRYMIQFQTAELRISENGRGGKTEEILYV